MSVLEFGLVHFKAGALPGTTTPCRETLAVLCTLQILRIPTVLIHFALDALLMTSGTPLSARAWQLPGAHTLPRKSSLCPFHEDQKLHHRCYYLLKSRASPGFANSPEASDGIGSGWIAVYKLDHTYNASFGLAWDVCGYSSLIITLISMATASCDLCSVIQR